MARSKEQNNNYTKCIICNKKIIKQQLQKHIEFKHMLLLQELDENVMYMISTKKLAQLMIQKENDDKLSSS